MRPKGFLSISKITLADGTEISTQRAVEYGRRAEELAVRAEGIAREKKLGATPASPPRP